MKYDAAIPIYLQVITAIKQDIVSGRLSPGEKMLSGRDLALRYTINPNTSARVYQELERQELCFTKRGLGTFVTEDPERIASLREEMAAGLLKNFLEGMRQLGIPDEDTINLVAKQVRGEKSPP